MVVCFLQPIRPHVCSWFKHCQPAELTAARLCLHHVLCFTVLRLPVSSWCLLSRCNSIHSTLHLEATAGCRGLLSFACCAAFHHMFGYVHMLWSLTTAGSLSATHCATGECLSVIRLRKHSDIYSSSPRLFFLHQSIISSQHVRMSVRLIEQAHRLAES